MEDNFDQSGKSPPEVAVSKPNEKEVTDLEKATEMIKSIALTEKGDIKKPLNPEAVRTLLEQSFRMILSREASDSNFLKCLFISRRSFNVARSYPIFCLAVSYQFDDILVSLMNLAMFKLPIIEENFEFSKDIIFSYQKINSLLSMLKPNHFLMMLGEEVSNQNIKKAIGHLNFIHGKIALVFRGDFQTEFSLLFNHLSRRKLEYLDCLPEFLPNLDATLKIGHYGSILPINNLQLHKVLSCAPDSLICKIDDNFIEQAEFPPSLDHCNSLKWVALACNEHHNSLMAFLNIIEGKCSKLKEICIYAMIILDNLLVSNADDILDNILAAQGQLWRIIEKCRPLVSRLKIVSNVHMIYHSNDEFPCREWIGRAKKIDWFKNSIHGETIEQTGNHQFKVCRLLSKFSDGFFELYHEIKLSRFVLQ